MSQAQVGWVVTQAQVGWVVTQPLWHQTMRRYLRSRAGQVYFFTVVTHDRRRILTTEVGRTSLRAAIRAVRTQRPFHITAVVLLPDHVNMVWELQTDDTEYSTLVRLIKAGFTRIWLEAGGVEGTVGASRRRREERGVWQRRFYEHTCRDDEDVQRCVDYIHVNPLKHHLVDRVVDWPWSSFHRYVRLGDYPSNWGGHDAWYGDEFRHAE